MLNSEENELITQTGPGTPMGELFRRFWQPALLSSELPHPDCPPIKLTLLSEDLVAYRDTTGQVGVLDRYCPHRGSSLYWGRNEEEGLRCVYHGWKFDVSGACVDMPNEPAASRFKEKIKTIAYPAEERGGVIWIYMGPATQRPELPNLEWTRVPESHRYVSKRIQLCNYLQNVEGEVDSSHLSYLHSRVQESTTSNNSEANYGQLDKSPVFSVLRAEHGLKVMARRDAGDDAYYWRITPFLMPTYTMIPTNPGSAQTLTGAVPITDTSMFGLTVTWHPDRPLNEQELAQCREGSGPHVRHKPGSWEMLATKENDYLIDREIQRTRTFTGIFGVREQDVAVQEDQWGPTTKRWREHLGTTDLAVIAMRRLLLDEARDLQNGIEPPEPHNAAAYNVRSASIVLDRTIDVDEGSKPFMLIGTR